MINKGFSNKKIVIIGGSSGIGFSIAEQSLNLGAEVVLAGRNLEKLNDAKERLGNEKVEIFQVDLFDAETLENLFKEIGSFDHLQIPGSNVVSGKYLEFSVEEARKSFDSKFWGPYNAARLAHPYINKESGTITFFAGAYSEKPFLPGASVTAAVNGAVESLSKALAYELSPVRVNTVSPGLTLTERFTDNFSKEALDELINKFSKALIIKRPATPDEVAQSAIYLMQNTYLTGTTQFVDGGLTLR